MEKVLDLQTLERVHGGMSGPLSTHSLRYDEPWVSALSKGCGADVHIP